MFYPIVISSPSMGAELSAQAAKMQAASAEQQIAGVSHDIERLLMITEALWILLKKERGYTDADLVRLVSEIDLRDGSLDGRVARKPPQSCSHCSRPLAKSRPLCIYCGEPVQPDPFSR
jgi:hypothetical protein